MGSYTNELFKRGRLRSASNPKGYKKPPFDSVQSDNTPQDVERLATCGIIRDGVTHSYGFKSHADIRRKLGDENPYESHPGDEEGFVTSEGRFLDRQSANIVGYHAGQCSVLQRKMLSSDISKW